ncbi:hypothetical protein [Pedobacter sp. MC2016-24]|uniref:hypothetical protein n=1 Tax=Pedobacter sp. MC2016-24 TaxID=2780090 RepID=UPI001882E002|nr:hypothetical protein [Pedobacter sp. MC2016-24]MBE9602267.1 hypothetical protein [Pedobacter sp. MC2016-24]
MKKKYCIVLIAALGIQGCSSENGDPFAEFDPYIATELPGRIEAYNNARDTNSIKSGNVALYIDFSAGMNTAFSNPEIKHLMGDCFNAVLADQFDVYKLVSGAVTPLEVTNPTELGEKVSDAKEYLNRRAPIQMGVEKIVASNSDALLITDFEEFQNDKEVTSTAYLKISFSKWLAKGNAVNFFVANYNEGKVTKHIYFTIFSCGRPDTKSLLSKLEPKLSLLNSKFELSTQSFKLSTDYPTEKSGGIFYDPKGTSEATRNVLDLKSNYVNGLKNGRNFEFYPFGVDWNTIGKLHESYNEQHQFNDFFRKLWIDLSNEDSYLFGDFAVNVSDVSEDYEQFSKCLEVKKHKPKLAKGSNGEAKFADEEKDPIAMKCYNTDGFLKPEWMYKAKDPVALTEVFVLNQTLFKNTKTINRKKTELGVSFDPQFKVKNIQNPGGLLRVDIVLKNPQPNLANPALDQFKWVNESGISNIALRESIVSTLQDIKPENKVVYSYYIKTNQ